MSYSDETERDKSKTEYIHECDDGTYTCLICDKNLSTKQRIRTHLTSKKHRLSPWKRIRKRYVEDGAVSVPRSTLYRWKRNKIHLNSSDLSTEEVDDPSPLTDTDDDEETMDCVSRNFQEGLDSFQNEQLYNHQDGINNSASTCSSEEGNSVDISVTASLLPPDSFLPSSSDWDSGSCHSTANDTLKIENNFEDYSSDSSDCHSTSTVSSDHSVSDSESTYSDTDTSDNNSEDEMDSNIKHSDLPVKEFQALSLISCFLRNNLSTSACKDVVETLKATFTTSEEISTLDFNELMSHIDLSPVHEVHYCIQCLEIFPEDKDVFQCQNPNCDGLRYKGSLAAQTNKSQQPRQCFVFADVNAQLVALLETPGIWENIQDTKDAAFERFESGSTVLTDILDGSGYRAMMGEDGFLNKTSHNLTGVFNTDGVNLFSSSKIDLWPIFLAINELSPSKRFARENIILIGIWQGKGKPPFNQFLSSFVQQMNSLYTDGVQIQIDGNSLTVKLSVVCCVADLPAKAELLNMSYFNGPHACIKCEESGKSVKQGKGSAKCYPYNVHGSRSNPRTQESVLHHMSSGSPNNRSKGFKGNSALSNLQNYDLVKGSVPDYMHGVLLGVTKTLMTKWFSSSNNKKDYFIGNHLKEISNRMKNLKPPEGIERLPRDLEKHYSHFKATECQSWLLYYAYPCVNDFLKDEYLENYSYLSEAIHILLSDAITHEMFVEATDLLDQFYGSFQRLYGDGSCGLNVHNTGFHLPQYVGLWGPLWAWSAFPFEDVNAVLLRAVHGTGSVLKQVLKFRQTQSCIRRKGLDLKKIGGRKITHIAENCDIAGATKSVKPDKIENEVRQHLDKVQVGVDKIKRVDRIIVNEKRFYSEQYSRMQKRICSVVSYGNDEVGTIKYFILCNDIVYAVIQKMQKIPAMQIPGARIANHYTAVIRTQLLSVVDVAELKEVLVYLNTNADGNVANNVANYPHVVRMPNSYGHAVFK